MNKIENKEFSDQNERLSLSSKIDKQLNDLKNKSEGLLEQAEKKISQDALKDTIAELEGQEKNPDELIVSDHDDDNTIRTHQKNYQSLSPQIKENIASVSENPASHQGRIESYTNVSDFSQQIVQQGGIFGKIVNRLS